MRWLAYWQKRLDQNLLAMAFTVCVCLTISCGDDGDDEKESTDDDFDLDDDGDDDLSDDDDDGGGGDPPELCEDVWTDDLTGLVWQKCLLVSADLWYDVDLLKYHCEELEYAGYTDWRMPTIDELRTLIVSCSKTETGGECGVVNECYEEGCRNDACDGCDYSEGPGDGCFQNAHLNFPCYGFWSSMAVEAPESDPWYEKYLYWYVAYASGSIRLSDWYDVDPAVNKIRCVRSLEKDAK